MYDKSDPRAALATAAASPGAPMPGTFDAADYLRFSQTDPDVIEKGARTWLGRGHNFLLAYTEAEEEATLARTAQLDEYAILLPERSTRIEVSAGGATQIVEGYHLVFVPPGDSTVRLLAPGRLIRVLTTRSVDLAAACSNAGAYAAARPIVAPLADWPTPPDGLRIRAYSLDVPPAPGRFGRIWRCTTIMINWLDHLDGPRDPGKLSPHHHDDFEQGSLALDGEFIHHLRWPWTTNKAAWRSDEHEHCGTP